MKLNSPFPIHPTQLSIFFVLFMSALQYCGQREAFWTTALLYLLSCLSYLLILFSNTEVEKISRWIGIGFLIRIMGIFAFPYLSDDIYRFWWDGFLITKGINPFSYTPTELMQMEQMSSLHKDLGLHYSKLNSPNYHSVYPPLAQFVFSFSARLAGANIYIFSIILKLVILLADLIIVFSAKKILSILSKHPKMLLIYFLNPLVIMELNGNLHFESWMIAFMGLSILYLQQQKTILSAATLGMSFLAKMISLITFPWYLLTLRKKKSMTFSAILITFISLFLLMIPWSKEGISGFQLYFQKFEFNSSIYKLLQLFAEENKWWKFKENIGFILAIISLMTILTLWLYDLLVERETKYKFQSVWYIWMVYLLMGSTVHPWYLTPILFLAVFSHPLTSIAWSFMIVGTYIHYDPDLKHLFSGFVVLEYFFLFVIFIIEIKYKPQIFKNAFSLK
ncbi:MAG: hypothetical protein IPM48_00735 [Saprospiraceae bacterium]|nr:hypothetical protein [Saprospiraceae bacterium]